MEKRESLFKIQLGLCIASLILLVFVVQPKWDNISWKAAVAPFASIGGVLFLLFVFNKVIKVFGAESFKMIEIAGGFATVGICIFLTRYLILQLLNNNAPDTVIFFCFAIYWFVGFLPISAGKYLDNVNYHRDA